MRAVGEFDSGFLQGAVQCNKLNLRISEHLVALRTSLGIQRLSGAQ